MEVDYQKWQCILQSSFAFNCYTNKDVVSFSFELGLYEDAWMGERELEHIHKNTAVLLENCQNSQWYIHISSQPVLLLFPELAVDLLLSPKAAYQFLSL